ncbi:helicase [Jeotgalibacillus sp. R-1-5s-1]|uniref:helicase n=1 Tax=Jeotgalibacillus sp. R-1-5s-1 TaxID=2555897 RepID=UPI00106A0105|nr:helicase [Jeotgalibacillus sp. R-1-5s-1]TFD94341.1 helicase [Jeotgalibacillus sp. R-1-5s-1]
MQTYPDCPVVTRKIEVGGLTKQQLLQRLQQHAILLNEYGERLFSDNRFTTSNETYNLETVELTVKALGFPEGATLPEIFERAIKLGLDLCPLETGPYLRVAYQNQPEGDAGNSLRKEAPSGSLTIASEIISEEDDYPKGFYLRNIEGVLWLRGYAADDLHVWNAGDCFVFCKR